MNIFWCMKILWICLGVITKLDFLGSFLCILESFLEVKVQIGIMFRGLLKFQIYFWYACDICFGWGEVNRRCWV